jgi:RNA 3'-terminal phosphate cyclase
MLVLFLFDQGAPRGVARALRGHTVVTAKAKGWDRLTNGVLLKVAEEAAVDLLLTTDQTIGYQQNLTDRKIAIVVLAGTTRWSRVRLHLERIAAVVDAAMPGSYAEIDIPFD